MEEIEAERKREADEKLKKTMLKLQNTFVKLKKSNQAKKTLRLF